MNNNQIGLSFQEMINQEDAILSPYSTGDGNSCMATKMNCSSVDDFDDNVDRISAFVAPFSKTPSDSFVDKSVLECQISKTIVCDKEINVNDVKDICIDEGVSSLDNIFFRNTMEKSISKILPMEEDQNDGSTKEQENSSELSKSIADDRKITVENSSADWTNDDDRDLKSISKILPMEEDQNDGATKEQENSSELSKSIADDRKITVENSSADWTKDDDRDLTQIEEEKLNLSDPHVSMQKLVGESYSSESLDNIAVQISSEKANLEDPASVSKSVEPCNGNSALGFAAEPPNDSNLSHPSAYNSEVERGSITFNFNPCSPVADDGAEHHENINANHSAPMASAVTQERRQSSDSAVETQTNMEIRTSDARLISSQTPHDFGESSFSAVDPLASLVNYSGPIAYSGSISLRSESSTTSTRSFAFPILQSEWNTSPVKMVKAERRHYRKYRGWREGLLCCRF